MCRAGLLLMLGGVVYNSDVRAAVRYGSEILCSNLNDIVFLQRSEWTMLRLAAAAK